MRSLPYFWLQNSASRIATAAGMTNGLNALLAALTPSSALRTEMAGVIAPSP